MRGGGDFGVRGPEEACAAWRAGQGRQRRGRLPIIAVGGHACTGWDDGEERESEVRLKKKRWNRRMESGVGNRVFGTRKRFRELGFRVLGGF